MWFHILFLQLFFTLFFGTFFLSYCKYFQILLYHFFKYLLLSFDINLLFSFQNNISIILFFWTTNSRCGIAHNSQSSNLSIQAITFVGTILWLSVFFVHCQTSKKSSSAIKSLWTFAFLFKTTIQSLWEFLTFSFFLFFFFRESSSFLDDLLIFYLLFLFYSQINLLTFLIHFLSMTGSFRNSQVFFLRSASMFDLINTFPLIDFPFDFCFNHSKMIIEIEPSIDFRLLTIKSTFMMFPRGAFLKFLKIFLSEPGPGDSIGAS